MEEELKIYEVPEFLEKTDYKNNIAKFRTNSEFGNLVEFTKGKKYNIDGTMLNILVLDRLPIFKKVRDLPENFSGIFWQKMYYILLEDIRKYAKKKNSSTPDYYSWSVIWDISKLFDIRSDIIIIEGIGAVIYFIEDYDLNKLEEKIEYEIYGDEIYSVGVYSSLRNISYWTATDAVFSILNKTRFSPKIIKNVIDIAIIIESSRFSEKVSEKISEYHRLKYEEEKRKKSFLNKILNF